MSSQDDDRETYSVPNSKSGKSIGSGSKSGKSGDHDTLGLRWEDEPNKGGVEPDADASMGGISAITTPEMMPVNHIKIPLPLDEVLSPIIDVGGGSTSSNTYTGDWNVPLIPTTNHEIRKKLAKQNLQAGMKALENLNFDIAADNFKAGRKKLGLNGWDEDRPTMLKLCSEGAYACYITDDSDTMNELINEVLSKGSCIKETFRVYEVKMLAEQAAGRYQESLSLGIAVRQQLNLPTPSNKSKRVSTVMILWGYFVTNRALGKRTAEELAKLPTLTDERIIMGQRMLELLLTSCYQVQPNLFPLLIFQITNTSLEHGINASTCDAYTTFGIILSGPFGKPQRGREMAMAAELIFAKPGMTRMKSRSTYGIQGFINHWTLPLRETLTPLIEGYRIGLEVGDAESAKLNLGFRVAHTFYAGHPLETDFVAEMINLHIEFHHPDIHTELFLQIYLLAIKKLTNVDLEENEKDFDGIMKKASENFDNKTMQSYVYSMQLELEVFSGNWSKATDILVEAGDVRAILLGPFAGVRYTVFDGLISLKAASSSIGMMRWKWKRRARKSIKLIHNWVEKGNVNIVHSLHLLEAELAVLNGSKSYEVRRSYASAIAIAEKNEFIQDQALSNELASAYFARSGDDSRRDYHMENAIKCYSEWGATAKVEQLTKR